MYTRHRTFAPFHPLRPRHLKGFPASGAELSIVKVVRNSEEFAQGAVEILLREVVVNLSQLLEQLLLFLGLGDLYIPLSLPLVLLSPAVVDAIALLDTSSEKLQGV